MTNLKALASPKAMKIHRKEKVWVISPAPGPHPADLAVPLGIMIRDYLGLAENRKEIKFILNNNIVLVDGRRVKDDKYPIGLFDIVSIEKIDKTYLMLVDNRARLIPKEVKGKHDTKLCRLLNKTMIKGGKLQLNLYDGKNLLIETKDSKKYQVGGTAVVKVPEMKIVEFIEPGVGKVAFVAKGRHAGKMGKIVEVTKAGLNLQSLTTIECDGEKVTTNTDYIYIVGDKTSKIAI